MRILFVEKNPTTADLLVPSLERKGYDVLLAHSQREATVHIRSAPPDLLIVDVASFGKRGYQLCDRIRARLQALPTVLLLEDGHAAFGEAADAFMTPPFTSRKLLYRVGQLADRVTHRYLQAGHLQLDPDTRTLQNGIQSIHLRPKEAVLLRLFMRNPDKVLSRQQIMKEVWETDYVDDTRTLSVHVRWLRQKIEENPNQPCVLHTVRGVGYRFQIPEEPSSDRGRRSLLRG
jgi:DNA-binding response OmpR family regulator